MSDRIERCETSSSNALDVVQAKKALFRRYLAENNTKTVTLRISLLLNLVAQVELASPTVISRPMGSIRRRFRVDMKILYGIVASFNRPGKSQSRTSGRICQGGVVAVVVEQHFGYRHSAMCPLHRRRVMCNASGPGAKWITRQNGTPMIPDKSWSIEEASASEYCHQYPEEWHFHPCHS